MQFGMLASALLTFIPLAAGEAFLGGPSSGGRSLNTDERDRSFREAMGTVLGCGADIGQDHLVGIEKVLTSMWRALPKNQWDRVEWRMLRYVAHRYFMKQSSLLIRGIEPTRGYHESELVHVDIIQSHAPSLAEKIFEGTSRERGFTLEDAVTLVATMEQLIFESESDLLEASYIQQYKSLDSKLDWSELGRVIESYLVHWLMEGDTDTAWTLLSNDTLLRQVLPDWDDLIRLAAGTAKGVEFSMQRSPRTGYGGSAMTHEYSFAEAHEAIGSITKSFASFWEGQCQDMKSRLVALDKTSTGRIRVTDFYGANADGDWRFGESVDYLREIGALDETSVWRGQQVIISNYLLGASNCIVSTPNYLVCCVNECEDIMYEIEDTLQAPIARPDDVLRIVANMTNFNDEPPTIGWSLRQQLYHLADAHAGNIRVHGRSFSQWLHYVFPHECPFPHKPGTASSVTLSEFGRHGIASEDVVRSYAEARNSSLHHSNVESVSEEQWMSQWSEEDDIIMDDVVAPPRSSRSASIALLAVVLMLFGASKMMPLTASKTCGFTGCDQSVFRQNLV